MIPARGPQTDNTQQDRNEHVRTSVLLNTRKMERSARMPFLFHSLLCSKACIKLQQSCTRKWHALQQCRDGSIPLAWSLTCPFARRPHSLAEGKLNNRDARWPTLPRNAMQQSSDCQILFFVFRQEDRGTGAHNMGSWARQVLASLGKQAATGNPDRPTTYQATGSWARQVQASLGKSRQVGHDGKS